MFETVTSFLESSRDPRTFNEGKFIDAVYKLSLKFGENGNAYDYQKVLSRNRLEWSAKSMGEANLSKLDGFAIFTLIVGACRADYMCNGTLMEEFLEPGLITKWLEALKKVDEANPGADAGFYKKGYIFKIKDITKDPKEIKTIRYVFKMDRFYAITGYIQKDILEIFPDGNACFTSMEGKRTRTKLEFTISRDEPCCNYEFLMERPIEYNLYRDIDQNLTVVLQNGKSVRVKGEIRELTSYFNKLLSKLWESVSELEKIGKSYSFAGVSFSGFSDKTYDYRYDKSKMNLNVGDMVKVKTSHGDCVVKVEKLFECYKDEIPLPLEKYKWIVEKVEDFGDE